MKLVRTFFSSRDYAQGMDYYREGRVLDMTSEEGEYPLVTCSVRGSKLYSVHFQETGYGYIRIGCSCPRFDDMGRCKHIAAAMIAYALTPPQPAGTHSDYYAQTMLQKYLQKNRDQPMPPAVPARLVPRLDTPYHGYPAKKWRKSPRCSSFQSGSLPKAPSLCPPTGDCT